MAIQKYKIGKSTTVTISPEFSVPDCINYEFKPKVKTRRRRATRTVQK